MNARLRAISLRRAMLAADIELQRGVLRESLMVLRDDLALAGLGYVASRALVRRPWLRAAVLGALAVFAARRVASRSQARRHQLA